jgi:hypothetical protein
MVGMTNKLASASETNNGFFIADLSIWFRNPESFRGRNDFTVERPARDLWRRSMTAGFLTMAALTERRYRQKQKRLQTPAKRRMKASNEPCRKPSDRLASSFSLTEKWLIG